MKKKPFSWRNYWEELPLGEVSDFWVDRGHSSQDRAFEQQAQRELLEFVGVKPQDVVLDAGCGTGGNLLLLKDSVREIVGMDYSPGMAGRARLRLDASRANAQVPIVVGSIVDAPFADATFDRILCISVLQYVNDDDCRSAIRQMYRIARPGATATLHVKNLASLYISTLFLAKKIKVLLGGETAIAHYRSYKWYEKVAREAGFELDGWHSHNIFSLDFLPKKFLFWWTAFERRHYKGRLFRRHGAEYFLRLKKQGV